MSVAWSPRWVKVRSGRNKKSLILEDYQVVGSVRHIAVECKISIGLVSKVLREFETGRIIKLVPVSFGRKRKPANIIELIDPFMIALVAAIREHKIPTRNVETMNSKYEKDILVWSQGVR